MISSIILDFDDTLAMTEEACFYLENAILTEKMGLQPMSRQIHKETWGMQLSEAIKLRSPGVDVGVFWQHLPTVHERFISEGKIDVVLDSDLAVLDELIERGFQLFVLTSRTETEIRHLLNDSHPLSSRILSIYHAENTVHTKPDPRAFNVLLEDYALLPTECVYVGDSPSDGVAANGANMKFIASLQSGIRKQEDFDHVSVDVFIDALEDLPGAIRLLT